MLIKPGISISGALVSGISFPSFRRITPIAMIDRIATRENTVLPRFVNDGVEEKEGGLIEFMKKFFPI